jgi:hypothetical protein
MNTGDWGWDTQVPLPARATIVLVICVSDLKTHLTKFSDDQHAGALYLMIGNIRKDIHHTLNKHV